MRRGGRLAVTLLNQVNMIAQEPIGRIKAIALRTPNTGPMRLVESAHATVGEGIDGDVKVSPSRGITFLATGQWGAVCRQLDVDLPWHTRRANVLVEADSLVDLIGRNIRFGEVVVAIKAETRPCELMDTYQAGLREALSPECRAGVYGRVMEGGRFAVGDMVTIDPAQAGDAELKTRPSASA